MAAYSAKSSLPGTLEQSLIASKSHCWRQLGINIWRITTALLFVGIYWWVQRNSEFAARERLESDQTSIYGVDPDFDWYALRPSEDISWTSCFNKHKCARLILPLDYSIPDGPKTEIALRMLPATDKENYRATILVNPGGPGGSGTTLVGQLGGDFATVVGPEFDILGFDPRGTGATTPRAQCFASESQAMIWDLQDGPLLNVTDESIPLAQSRQKAMAELCLKAMGGNGKEELNGKAEEWGPGRFMTTTSVATDMLRIVEKLGQGKLQYWGFSYGSVLGQYFAAMYPSKVSRLVIDGVVDANDYRAGEWYSTLDDTDAVLLSFFEFCHRAGPSKCPLYGSTVPSIRKRVDTIIDSLSQAPVPIPFSSKGPVMITKKVLHQLMFGVLYSPTMAFPILANSLIAVETDNISALTDIADQFFDLGVECSCASPLPWQQFVSMSATFAIACGDADKHPNGPDDYKSYFDKLMAKSAFAAPIWGVNYLACSEWKMTPKWRYTGPFAANTSYPLLIVSTKFDPVCPLTNAKAVQKRYAGSALLVQNSYGHCTPSSPSLCTAKHIRAYFREGTLPAAGTACEVEELPFIGEVENDVKVLSSEDVELLEALRALARVVPRFGLV